MHKLLHKKRDLPQDDGYKYSGPLRPYPYSFAGRRKVPDHIKKPDYWNTGNPNSQRQQVADKIIPTYTPEEIELIRQTSSLARDALDVGHKAIAVGVTTEEIDRIVHDFIVENGGYPSPLNYYNFPRSCCTSINEVICHGIPDTRPL
jgi:methionyl aminopeptidase